MSVQLHTGAEGHPSAVGGAATPAEGSGLAFGRRRKRTRVGQSGAECTGPKGQRGRFRWGTKKWRRAARGNGLKSKNKEKWVV
jgi:hypothetical protein